MYCPVASAFFAVFIRAIEWVNNPYSVGAQALVVVGAFFRQHRIVWSVVSKGFHEKAMANFVASVFHVPLR